MAALLGGKVRGRYSGPWLPLDMEGHGRPGPLKICYERTVLGVASTCSSVCTALHASRLSHSEPPSATPSPALSVESLSSEGSSQTTSGQLLEPPAVPKSSSEPAVHAPGTPVTSASLSADSSLSSSGELVQPAVGHPPQASPGLAPSTKGSSGPQPAKPCSGATPTPLLLVGDKTPVPSPGSSSPQLQVKVSASPSLKAAVLPSGWGLASGQECPGPSIFADHLLPN